MAKIENNTEYDVIVIGGGPAGLAAAIEAKKKTDKVLIIERDVEAGGILNQCIHNGFGIHEFKEELTGPEYAARFIEEAEKAEIDILLNTMVIELTADRHITAVNEMNLYNFSAKAVVLAMGCRERTAGAIGINGYRPSGVYTAGMAQRMANHDGYMVGKNVVIYGSGDIGLIMARRMTLEGAKVKACVEIMPHSSGLARNIAQCLDDFDIPLLLSHSIREIHGKDRVTGVTICKVDENRRPIEGTDRYIECDTLLLSVGLLPENELSQMAGVLLSPITSGPIVDSSMMTETEGIFACGNVLHVHDIVDFVTRESRVAGKKAADFAIGNAVISSNINSIAGTGIRYVLPQKIVKGQDESVNLFMRCDKIYRDAYVTAESNGNVIKKKRMRIMIPSEMISMELKKEDFANLTSDITFKVEEN